MDCGILPGFIYPKNSFPFETCQTLGVEFPVTTKKINSQAQAK